MEKTIRNYESWKPQDPRVLEFSEAIQYDRKVMWIEFRETPGVIPVTYYAEQKPFLKFDAEDRMAMFSVRAEWYDVTWRCWDKKPLRPTDWEQQAGKPKTARGGAGTATGADDGGGLPAMKKAEKRQRGRKSGDSP